ncbi:MAG: hypothetical protein PWQ54_1694 [Bacteroidales bacterium]|nr:hypothetical protein [Bacteroidales bacterium]
MKHIQLTTLDKNKTAINRTKLELKRDYHGIVYRSWLAINRTKLELKLRNDLIILFLYQSYQKLMNKAAIDQKFLPELSLLLNKLSGNHENWLQTALQLYQNSDTLARVLLLFYNKNDQKRFIAIT